MRTSPAVVLWAGAAPLIAAGLEVRHLRTEYLTNPLAVESPAPRLTWNVESAERGQKQTAYRILVASSAARLARNSGDLWDSGRVASAETVSIPYGGRPLASRLQCFWKVRVWDASGRESGWSAPAAWSMGLLKPQDWKAQWISFPDPSPVHSSRSQLYLPPARCYRNRFTANGPVRRAVLYGSALGIFDPYLNGRRAGDTMFAPGWSDYRQRAYYRAWDVTAQVKAGENLLGAVVADGWYAGYVGYGLLVGYGPNRAGRAMYGKTPALLLQLEIEYANGSRQTVATDASSWQQSPSPAIEADMLMGETYDARQEVELWTRADGWLPATPAAAAGRIPARFSDRGGEREVNLGFEPPARMQAYTAPDVRPVEELKPAARREPKPGVYVFDLGQNIAGVARLKVKGQAGTRVQLRFAEMVYPDGRLMTENLRKARATDAYILRGDPNGETWTPRFTYHGFQYVELTGYPGVPAMDAVTGIAVHSDMPLTSRFSASDEMLGRLHRNVVWTQRGNFVEVPTDCPQRDERLGWTGDAQIFARAATFHADAAAFYTKWLDDLDESQRPNGAFPDYAPYPMQHGDGYSYGTAWMDAGVIVPYHLWTAYGDTRLVERHWPAMQRFLRFRQTQSPDYRGVTTFNPWGDWLSIGSTTPVEYVDAAYFARSARLMAEMAAALGKHDEASQYREIYSRVRERFQRDWVEPGGRLKVNTQTAYALALDNGLFPEADRQAAAARLVELIGEAGGRMTTGFLGTYPLLPVLDANGHSDLAVRLLRSREFPSWGYEVENGATTIWERWNSYTKDKGFFSPAMNSYSHYAFGAVSEWMFRGVAGIDTDGPGYRKLLIKPGPGSLEWVKAEYQSIRGRIAVAWRNSGGRFELDVTIPPNVTATVGIPASAPVAAQPGAVFRETKDGRAWLEVASGTYHFRAP